MCSNVRVTATQRQVFSGPRLRAIREACGIRMVDLARACPSCTYTNLRLFEQGAAVRGRPRNLSPELANLLAQTLTEMSGRTVTPADFLATPDERAAA